MCHHQLKAYNVAESIIIALVCMTMVVQDTWDVAMLGVALNTVGVSVLQAATSVTGWIADLASAFDSGWGDVDDDDDAL